MIKINKVKGEGILAMSNQWAHVTSYIPQDFWWNGTNYTKGLYAQGDTVCVVKNFIRSGVYDQNSSS